MKTALFIIILFILISPQYYFSQTWSEHELAKANTCILIDDLSDIEKEAILYINLARLFPIKFAKIELLEYFGPEKYGGYLIDSPYKESLLSDLKTTKPMNALIYNKELRELAICFALEQGASGYMGHNRKKCTGFYNAECIAYDMETGKDIAMQLLIDHEVPSLGHREACLDRDLTKIGIGFSPHKKASFCAVLDFLN
jgi:hypothetical protein